MSDRRAAGLLGRLSRAQLNSVIYLGTSLLSKGISVLLIPLYTSRLSKVEYGAYGLAQTIYWIAPPIATASLSAALGRFFFDHKEPAERDRILSAITTPLVLAAVTAALVFELVARLGVIPANAALDPMSIRLVGWTCASVAIAEIMPTYLRADERAIAYAAYNLTVFCVTAGATAWLLLGLDLGLHGLLGGMCVGQSTGALLGLVFCTRRLRWRWDGALLRSALAYSMPFIPHVVGTALMSGVDRWALERYGFREELGLFTLAYQLTLPVQLATTAWNEASSPRFLAAWRDGGDQAARKALRRVVLGFIAASGGALLCVLIALPVLRYFIAPAFHGAFKLVPFIGLGLLIGTLFSAFINVLFLRKNTRLIPVLTLASVGVNVALNAFLVPRFAAYGAIAATGMALTFRTLAMYAFARRQLTPS